MDFRRTLNILLTVAAALVMAFYNGVADFGPALAGVGSCDIPGGL